LSRSSLAVNCYCFNERSKCESHFLTLCSAASFFSSVGVSILTTMIFPVVASTHTSVRSFLPRCATSNDQISCPVFFFKLSALDRAALNSSQRNFLSLMLRHARLLKQFRFTFLCPQIEGGPARGECQCSDRCSNWLHTNFDQSSVNMFGYLLKVGLD